MLVAQELTSARAADFDVDEAIVTAVATDLAAFVFRRVCRHSTTLVFGSDRQTAGMANAQAITAVDTAENEIFEVACSIATDAARFHAVAGAVSGFRHVGRFTCTR